MAAQFANSGATALTRQGAGADSADRGRRDQGRWSPPSRTPASRSTSTASAWTGASSSARSRARSRLTVENDDAARCAPIPAMKALIAAGLDRRGDRRRSRRGLDRGVRRIRARAGDARTRRPAEGIGADCRLPTCPRRVLGQPGAGGGDGGADRGRHDRTHGARHRRRRSRGRAICPHAGRQPRRRTAALSSTNIKASGERAAAANPDAVAAVQALTRFLESPGQTLIIKLTPRAKVPAMQLVQLLKTDPVARAGAIPDRGFDGDCELRAYSCPAD